MHVEIIPVVIEKEIQKGDDLAEIFYSNFQTLQDNDIVVVAQKIISKQEGKMIKLSNIVPSILSIGIGAEYKKDPKLVEVILSEAKRIVRMSTGIIITETKHGFICANSGVDESNLPYGFATLLPENPDVSALTLAKSLFTKTRKKVAILISDTFGRPFREGQINCAIGVSGIKTIRSYEGKKDTFDRTLRVTAIAQIDELCGAAELVMQKTKNCPFAVIRNFEFESSTNSIDTILRSKNTDLFR